jgi:hypothetical protein
MHCFIVFFRRLNTLNKCASMKIDTTSRKTVSFLAHKRDHPADYIMSFNDIVSQVHCKPGCVERRGRMVRMSDSQQEGRGFESQRRHGMVSVSRIP